VEFVACDGELMLASLTLFDTCHNFSAQAR